MLLSYHFNTPLNIREVFVTPVAVKSGVAKHYIGAWFSRLGAEVQAIGVIFAAVPFVD